jgi:hypothetical protein
MIAVLIANVVADPFCRHLVANAAHKVACVPELPCPQLLADLWKLFKHFPRADAFYDLHHLRWGIARSHLHKHMHMICLHCQFIKLPFLLVRYAADRLLHKSRYLSLQDLLAVFRRPDKVVFQIVDGMACAFDGTHASILTASHLHATWPHSSPQQAAEHSAVCRKLPPKGGSIGGDFQSPEARHSSIWKFPSSWVGRSLCDPMYCLMIPSVTFPVLTAK